MALKIHGPEADNQGEHVAVGLTIKTRVPAALRWQQKRKNKKNLTTT